MVRCVFKSRGRGHGGPSRVYQQDAKDLLSGWLNTAPAAVTELRVIHGYQRGTALRDMLRSGFSHPRVKAVLPSLNPGETRLVLKK